MQAWWRASTILPFGVDLIDSLLEQARVPAAAIRARVRAVVDIALAAVAITAVVCVMNGGGPFHRRHLLAEARRHLAPALRGRRCDPGLDEQIVQAALGRHCADVTEAKGSRGELADYRLYSALGRR